MLTKENGRAIPLYIGKAETLGKKGNLSANIKGVSSNANKGKFARWGDGRQYHIGDLSAAVLIGYEAQSVDSKYTKWASAMFESFPTNEPKLKYPVFLWAKAWGLSDIGVWPHFGPTRLTFQEYLLIGLCSSLFGNRLLNSEGQNRQPQANLMLDGLEKPASIITGSAISVRMPSPSSLSFSLS